MLPTRVILSHLAHGAKPIFNATQARKHDTSDLGFEEDAEKKGARKVKRRRGPRTSGNGGAADGAADGDVAGDDEGGIGGDVGGDEGNECDL